MDRSQGKGLIRPQAWMENWIVASVNEINIGSVLSDIFLLIYLTHIILNKMEMNKNKFY
jgi:hypothetical protein